MCKPDVASRWRCLHESCSSRRRFRACPRSDPPLNRSHRHHQRLPTCPIRKFGRECHNLSCCSLRANREPKRGHSVSFITPLCDTVLNREGEMRIDSRSTHRIDVECNFSRTMDVESTFGWNTFRHRSSSSVAKAGKCSVSEVLGKGLGLRSCTAVHDQAGAATA